MQMTMSGTRCHSSITTQRDCRWKKKEIKKDPFVPRLLIIRCVWTIARWRRGGDGQYFEAFISGLIKAGTR